MATALSITNIKLGSHGSPRIRKFLILEILVIPETTSPKPKVTPKRYEIKHSFSFPV
jgi:hypothetical protein